MKKSIQKKFYYFISVTLFITGCRVFQQNTSSLDGSPNFEQGQNSSTVNKETEQESQFRNIFAKHLRTAGHGDQAIFDAIFMPPAEIKNKLAQLPQAKGANFLTTIDSIYQQSDPTDWYLEGKKIPLTDLAISSRSPVTFIILPGFSSEFINSDPFEEILNNKNSSFSKKAIPIVEKIDDTVFSVKENKQVTIKLAEVVKVGSKDDNQGVSMVNLIMLSPKIGSLESVGTLESTIPIYQRRLEKILPKIPDLGTIYLLGYSRGAIVGLELLRATYARHKQDPKAFSWINRIHGIVSLGGVLYGTELADHTFKDQASIQSKTRQALQNIASQLDEGPPGLCATAFNPDFRSIMSHNLKVYSQAITAVMQTSYEPTRGKIGLLISEEKLRGVHYGRTYPGIFANLDQIQKLLFDLVNIKSPVACYSDNVRAFKKIVSSVIDGAYTLTTEARLNWWRTLNLPKNFRILSLGATMPGPVKNNKISPIINLPYYGYQTPDFIFVQRPSYYVMLENGASELNDSAVSVQRARYWPQLDPIQGRQYDQLGVLGSHHFGIGFHLAVSDCKGSPNPFPRSELISALASYVRKNPRMGHD